MHSVLKYLLLGGMHRTAADMATVQLRQKETGFWRIDELFEIYVFESEKSA